MKVIEIEDEEAKERPLSDHEKEEMLAVKSELSSLMGKIKPREKPDTTPVQASHLVYLANLTLHGTGNPSQEKRTQNTPVIIVGGEAHHALAFKTYGFTPHLLNPTKTLPPVRNGVAVSEKQLTKENAIEIIKRLAQATRLQIHLITDPDVDNLDLEIPGWKTKVIEYAVERHEGNEVHERIVTPNFGAPKLGPARWVVMQRVEEARVKRQRK